SLSSGVTARTSSRWSLWSWTASRLARMLLVLEELVRDLCEEQPGQHEHDDERREPERDERQRENGRPEPERDVRVEEHRRRPELDRRQADHREREAGAEDPARPVVAILAAGREDRELDSR